MFDPQCYYDSCRRLTLGQEKLEAMITMTKATEKKMFRRPARVALVAAAMVAALAVTAGAAQLEAVQQFFATVFVTVNTEDDAEQKVGIYSVSEETAGSVEITGGEGEVWNYQMEDGQLIPQP